MRIYNTDSKIGRELYHKKRKNYKRYKIGMTIVWGLLLIMVLINLGLVLAAENTYQIAENLFIGISFDMIFVACAFLARAFAVSGGREVLNSRLAERCMFTDHYFILEYEPHVHETLIYKCIQFKIRYEDIQGIVDEALIGRVAIYGTYSVCKYGADSGVESYVISDMPIYVYGYYKEYACLKRELLLVQRRGESEPKMGDRCCVYGDINKKSKMEEI